MTKNQKSVRSVIANGITAEKKVNSILVTPLPTYLKCQKCLSRSGIILENKLDGYELLNSDEKLETMKKDRHEMIMRNVVLLQDPIVILDKMIAFEEEKIEKEKKQLEIKRLIIETEQKALAASGKNLDKDAPKLVLIGTEIKIAGLFRDLFLSKMNKRGEQVFRGSHKVLAQWICDTINLENGEIMKYNSVYNYLSRNENPDNDADHNSKMN